MYLRPHNNLVRYPLGLLFLTLLICLLILIKTFKSPIATPLDSHKTAPSFRSADERLVYHNNIGIALLEQFNHEEALKEFANCLAIKKDFLPGIVNSALAHFYLQQFDQSEKFLKHALQINEKEPNTLFTLGMIHKNQDQLDLALESFKKVLLHDAEDPPTLYQLGQINLKKQKYDQAEHFLSKAVQLSPYDTAAHYSLAMSLLRKGEQTKGRAMIAKFMSLREKGGISSTGTQYGEQGEYMLAIGEYPYIKDLLPSQVISKEHKQIHFVDATKTTGIHFKHGAEINKTATKKDFPKLTSQWIHSMGSGAAFGDYDNDGHLDLFIANCGPTQSTRRPALYHNNGKGQFLEVTEKAGIKYQGQGMAGYWGDFNNDGYPDLFLSNYGPNVLYKNNGNGTFSDVTVMAGVGGDKHWHLPATPVDYDHDGDLDIYVGHFANLMEEPTKKSFLSFESFKGLGCHLFRNNGDETFSDVAHASGILNPLEKLSSIVFTDFDNRRDVDFWSVAQSGDSRLYSNQRIGTFLDLSQHLNSFKSYPSHSISTADLNKDGRMDFLLSPELGPLIWIQNLGQKDFKATTLLSSMELPPNSGSWLSHAFDYDNDGDLDVLELRNSNANSPMTLGGPELYQNLGNETFSRVTEQTGLNKYQGKAFRSATFGDYDNDGDTDIFLTVNSDSPLLLRNEGGNQNHWLKVRLLGTNSNKSGIGTKIEIKSGTLWQKLEVNGGSAYLSQNPPEVIFGLGQHQSVDALRLLWPGGVLQSEANLPINKTRLVHELDRKGTSCPLLYSWNGSQYQFVTDFLGGCAIGYMLAPGHYNTPDTDEYIKISQSQLRKKDGLYSLRINNQLEEVLYIDQTELLIIDHPKDIEIYPNERLMPGPPFPKHKIISALGAQPPQSAVNGNGQDVLPLITRVDRKYPDDFRLLPFKGYAEEHSLVLNLGNLAGSKKVNLLMTAWIDYADSTSNFQAAQSETKLIPPYLQVRNKQGHWQTVIYNMGFPAGLPKTMIVDLTDKFLASDYHVRIVTNMRIYWDQILVNTYNGQPTLRQYRMGPQIARLRFGGFPLEYSPDGRLPLIYNYNWIKGSAPWKSHLGNYTRYGPVTKLLKTLDDMYVIMRNGDEIHLEYDASKLPKLYKGWERTFFFFADGFGKDMDLHSAKPDRVTPLPFHAMSTYPYPKKEGYPNSTQHKRYQKEFNTRHISDTYSDISTNESSRRSLPSQGTPKN